jgi:hypothetical protein
LSNVIIYALWVVRLDLIRQHMQDLFIDLAGILADMQEVVFTRRKAGNIRAILKYPVFAFIIVVQIFAYLKVIYFFILTDCDRVIIHSYTTV